MEIGAEDDDPLADPLAEPAAPVLAVELLLLLLLLLLHAARAPTASATAPSATAFLENQGRCALTPGSSFLIADDSSMGKLPETSGSLLRGLYRRVPRAAR
jgi:hypothetical protein